MKISIITINYNNRDGLQNTIDSIVRQTWRNFEWIVIDGGSSDGSKELIEQYQENFAYWCSEPDNGVYHAMNKGVAQATGDYVNFMNSGDSFYDENVLFNLMKREPTADVLVGQVHCMGSDKIINSLNGRNVDFKCVYDGFCHQGTFTKLELLHKYPFDESLKIVSDWKFWLQTLALDNKTIQDVEIVVANYDMTGLSTIHAKERDEERLFVLKDMFGEKLIEEWSLLYRKQDYLKGELQIPAIKGLRYLLSNAPVLFSILYRIIMSFVKLYDFFCRKTSYSDFEK